MEKDPKYKEIKDLDFKNLDPQQAELLQKLIKVTAAKTIKVLEDTSGDKDKVFEYCYRENPPYEFTINDLIKSVKALNEIGLEHIIGYTQVIFDMEEIRQKTYLNSWRYKLKTWWKKTIKSI